MFLAAVRHLLGPEIDLVADESASGDEDEEEDERDEVGEARHCCCDRGLREEKLEIAVEVGFNPEGC